ncbi:hypothetical protein HKX48_005306 [Thoreauomyces humboldtii]|nr:hypothetical protein HKX48_005306 [Thoreauomyces humboldtii]
MDLIVDYLAWKDICRQALLFALPTISFTRFLLRRTSKVIYVLLLTPLVQRYQAVWRCLERELTAPHVTGAGEPPTLDPSEDDWKAPILDACSSVLWVLSGRMRDINREPQLPEGWYTISHHDFDVPQYQTESLECNCHAERFSESGKISHHEIISIPVAGNRRLLLACWKDEMTCRKEYFPQEWCMTAEIPGELLLVESSDLHFLTIVGGISKHIGVLEDTIRSWFTIAFPSLTFDKENEVLPYREWFLHHAALANPVLEVLEELRIAADRHPGKALEMWTALTSQVHRLQAQTTLVNFPRIHGIVCDFFKDHLNSEPVPDFDVDEWVADNVHLRRYDTRNVWTDACAPETHIEALIHIGPPTSGASSEFIFRSQERIDHPSHWDENVETIHCMLKFPTHGEVEYFFTRSVDYPANALRCRKMRLGRYTIWKHPSDEAENEAVRNVVDPTGRWDGRPMRFVAMITALTLCWEMEDEVWWDASKRDAEGIWVLDDEDEADDEDNDEDDEEDEDEDDDDDDDDDDGDDMEIEYSELVSLLKQQARWIQAVSQL